jgi:hypothetical protein
LMLAREFYSDLYMNCVLFWKGSIWEEKNETRNNLITPNSVA